MPVRNNTMYTSKIENIIQVSKEVIKDSLLENGAIVAANTTKDYYPSTAQNYLMFGLEMLHMFVLQQIL